jgi:hypothetical protein
MSRAIATAIEQRGSGIPSDEAASVKFILPDLGCVTIGSITF